MPDRSTPLTRRSLLVAGLGGVALTAAGCDAVTDLLGDEDDPAAAGGTASPAGPDADAGLVAQAAAAVAAAGALAAAVGAAVPALAADGRRLARVHAAHADRLGWSGTVDRPAVQPGRQAARRQLVQAEAALQAHLADAAEQAASGALAQTFASMAAAVAQQRAVLG